jgi:hypothetical protein
MAAIFYQWLLMFSMFWVSPANHPVYVTVTELEYNASENLLEGSCRLFTNDFEMALRKTSKLKIDLLHPAEKKEMEKLVFQYLESRLQINLDGKKTGFTFLGYEQVEDAIAVYFQISTPGFQRLDMKNSLLYELYPAQMSLVHITVNGHRQSQRLINPENNLTLSF